MYYVAAIDPTTEHIDLHVLSPLLPLHDGPIYTVVYYVAAIDPTTEHIDLHVLSPLLPLHDGPIYTV